MRHNLNTLYGSQTQYNIGKTVSILSINSALTRFMGHNLNILYGAQT